MLLPRGKLAHLGSEYLTRDKHNSMFYLDFRNLDDFTALVLKEKPYLKESAYYSRAKSKHFALKKKTYIYR